MNEIVNRLMENKQVELAKQIMESNGYTVSKKSKRLKESTDSHPGWKYDEDEGMYGKGVGDSYLTIYPPQGGESDWQVIVLDADGEEKDYEVGFRSFEEAEKWLKQRYINESRKPRDRKVSESRKPRGRRVSESRKPRGRKVSASRRSR